MAAAATAASLAPSHGLRRLRSTARPPDGPAASPSAAPLAAALAPTAASAVRGTACLRRAAHGRPEPARRGLQWRRCLATPRAEQTQRGETFSGATARNDDVELLAGQGALAEDADVPGPEPDEQEEISGMRQLRTRWPLLPARVKVEKIGRNTRRVSASIRVGAPIEAIWNSLTDYAHLAEFIPSLAVNEVVEVLPTGARLMQVGEQEVALGIKFRARVMVDVQEGVEVELPDAGRQRDIAFTMVEGDFQLFNGTWRMQSKLLEQETDLSYTVEVRPQAWLPVGIVEGRIGQEIQANLRSVCEEAVSRCRNQ
eukprot:SM000350S13034  [mRNA]  locus=s350:37660:39567:- [translate_table: standard]